MPGQRQGNPQLGFEICPHTCGCIITQSAANRSRRRPKWMKWVPLALKDGHHLVHHIKSTEVHPNCSAFCSRFESQARDLTPQEWTAWAPHLGHHTPFVAHIPPQYHTLIPVEPLEENYVPVFPTHPLPTAVPSLQHGMTSMSIHTTSAGPSTQSSSQHTSAQSTTVGRSTRSTSQLFTGQPTSAALSNPSTSATSQIHSGPKPILLFVEAPRLTRMEVTLEVAKELVVYGLYLLSSTTNPSKKKNLLKALRTAPAGMAIQEPPESDDPHPEVLSFYIHDMASIYP
jgi:hypothetical protein